MLRDLVDRAGPYVRWRLSDLNFPEIMLMVFCGPVMAFLTVPAIAEHRIGDALIQLALVLFSFLFFMSPLIFHRLLARWAPNLLEWLKPGSRAHPPDAPWDRAP